MTIEISAADAKEAEMFRQKFEAEREASRHYARLEILRMVAGTSHGASMTPAELVAAAKVVEAFVVGGAGPSGAVK